MKRGKIFYDVCDESEENRLAFGLHCSFAGSSFRHFSLKTSIGLVNFQVF